MKMKKMFKFFMCATIVASGFVGCSNEEVVNPNPVGPDGVEVSGEPTYATFNFLVDGKPLGSPATRNTLTSDQGEDANNAPNITSIRLIIFGMDATSPCEVDTIVTVSSGTINTSATSLLISGKKRILVIANTDGKTFDNQLKALKPASGQPVTYGDFIKAADGAKNLYDLGVVSGGEFKAAPTLADKPVGVHLNISGNEFVGTGKMVYSNSLADTSCVRILAPGISATDSKNATGDATARALKNQFDIYVQRTIAKVNVHYSKSPTSKGTKDSIATIDKSGMLSDFTWGVRNLNRAVGLFQQLDPAVVGKPIAPYYNVFDGKDDAFMKNLDSYAPYYYQGTDTEVNNAFNIGGIGTNSYYITENANNRSVKGNTTYAAIKAKYTPNVDIITIPGSYDKSVNKFTGVVTQDAATALLSTGGTFYRLTDIIVNGKTFFNGSITAGALFASYDSIKKVVYAMEKEETDTYVASGYTPTGVYAALIETYNGGACYYRLDLGEVSGSSKKRYIVRNYLYRADITGFSKIGSPSLSNLDKDPQTPNDEETNVTAKIYVLDWTTVNAGGEV
ncbi:MAG: Mfa1 family fimbria major subunit [Tannerellaceae bacterium]|jgi:hypothetical protein|nr:Mfa1 family fimbria major subunit [Tannerellaceae bacterium]